MTHTDLLDRGLLKPDVYLQFVGRHVWTDTGEPVTIPKPKTLTNRPTPSDTVGKESDGTEKPLFTPTNNKFVPPFKLLAFRRVGTTGYPKAEAALANPVLSHYVTGAWEQVPTDGLVLDTDPADHSVLKHIPVSGRAHIVFHGNPAFHHDLEKWKTVYDKLIDSIIENRTRMQRLLRTRKSTGGA